MKKTFAFLLILFFNALIFGSDFKFKLYNIEDGLNANFINDLTVDNKENIWLGTNMGLKKFDGFNFINYEITNFNRKEIKKLCYSNNSLYILYKGGNLLVLNLNNGIYKKISPSGVLDFYITPQKIVLLKNNFNIEVFEKKKRVNYKLKFFSKNPYSRFGKHIWDYH